MAMKKGKPRLAALLARRPGYAPKELPSLDVTRSSVARNAATALIAGRNPQSLATEEGVIPLPDEDELERVRRRRNARRGGGRASTVLSDENRLGG